MRNSRSQSKRSYKAELDKRSFSRARLFVLAGFLASATSVFSQAHQDAIEKRDDLPANSIQEKVRRIMEEDLEDEGAITELFVLGDEAVPSLIKFLSDGNKERRAGAARGLAIIGNQQGMQALRRATKVERDKEVKSAMSCFLFGGLASTKLESDMEFLRSSIEKARFADDNEEDFPAVCAALGLGMIGRRDSLAVLRKAAGADLVDSEEIGKAVKWIENKSRPGQLTSDPSLNDEEVIKRTVLERTFFAQAERDETSVNQLTFGPGRTKVLVSLEIYHGPRSARGYDLVLAKESGIWRVVGIWFAWVA